MTLHKNDPLWLKKIMSVDINILNPVGSISTDLFQFNAPTGVLPDLVLKYENPNKVLDLAHPDLVPLIERMLKEIEKFDSRDCVIDYKVRSLKTGDPGSTIPGFHIDCCNDIHDDFEPETHLIYSTVQGTAFAVNPIDVSVYNSVHEVLKNESITEVIGSTESVHRFTSKVLHRCPIIEHDCQRILIRVTSGFKDRLKRNRK